MGVLGLSPQSGLEGQSTVLERVLAAAPEPEISFWFKRDVPAGSAAAGVMTIGGRNQTLYVGAPEFGNVPENQLSWGLHLAGKLVFSLLLKHPFIYLSVYFAAVAVQGKDISINATTTVRSTFTSTELTIRGPIPDVAAIWAAIPGSNAIPAGDRTGPGYYFRTPQFY
jgi:cathepsin D